MFCITSVISNFYELINIFKYNESYIKKDDDNKHLDCYSRESSFNSVIIHHDIKELSILEKMLYGDSELTYNT